MNLDHKNDPQSQVDAAYEALAVSEQQLTAAVEAVAVTPEIQTARGRLEEAGKKTTVANEALAVAYGAAERFGYYRHPRRSPSPVQQAALTSFVAPAKAAVVAAADATKQAHDTLTELITSALAPAVAAVEQARADYDAARLAVHSHQAVPTLPQRPALRDTPRRRRSTRRPIR
jgi:hypothetical protein